jgi:hypothetical protein
MFAVEPWLSGMLEEVPPLGSGVPFTVMVEVGTVAVALTATDAVAEETATA